MNESLGDLIKSARKDKEIDISSIIKELGITEKEYLSIEEADNTDLPLSIYFKLAKILEIDFTEITSKLEELFKNSEDQ